MMRRIGFRRLLPLGNLALFLALVFAGAYQQTHHPRLQQVVFQEGPNFDLPNPPPQRFPTPWLIAIALNVPATILGAIAAALIHNGTNFGALVCSSPFLLLLWLFMGRWLDRQLGYLPRKTPAMIARIFCVAGAGLAVALFVVDIFALRAHQAFTSSLLAFALGWQLWSIILFVMCMLTLLRKAPAGIPAV